MNKRKNNLGFIAVENVNGNSYLKFERQFTNRAYKITYGKRERLASNLINVKCLELMFTHIHPNRIRIAYIKEL